MGNGVSCPVGFTPTGALLQCAYTCPTTKGLENRMVGNEPRCVYTRDPSKFVALKSAPMVTKATAGDPPRTLAWLQGNLPAEYALYQAAQDDAVAKIAVLLTTITREQQLTDAFQDLQTAENARDASPQAYQAARNRYYTLLRGDTWQAQERQRVLNAEVLPEIAPYIQSIQVASARESQQATTKSAVAAVKSNLISLKDDFRTTTTTLMKQVSELKNQIELQKRRAQETQAETSQWVLNAVLVLLSLVVIYILVRRILKNRSQTSPARPTTAQLSLTRPSSKPASTQTAGRR